MIRELWQRAMQAVADISPWILRDPRYWPSSRFGGSKTVSSEYVSEDIALNYSAVWCATRLLCGTAASLPLPIYTGLDGEKREKDRTHPLHKLLNGKPNSEQTAYAFRSLMWQWQVNWGNAYAEIQREGNTPDAPLVALWPLHPARVSPKRDRESGELYYEVRDEQTSETKPVPSWRIWHIPSILTADGIVGHGVITHARETVGAGIAAEKMGANAFARPIPPVYLKHKGKWDGVKKAEFRKEWEETYGTPGGERIAAIGGDDEIVPLQLNNVDMQYLQTRQFGIEEIARWYGIPPHMLQHLVQATYDNVENLGIEFVQYGLIPWLRQWEQSIWLKLLTEDEQEDYFAEHNVDALLRGDSAARAQFYHQGINDGWMSRNQVRKLENMDPVEGGDTFLVQGAMVPLDENGKPPEPPKPVGPSASKPADNAETIREEMAAVAVNLLKRDLGRMLTKESKAMVQIAKNDGNFVRKVDEFYRDHWTLVEAATADTLAAISRCDGTPVGNIASAWCNAGKESVLYMAGTAKNQPELAAAVAELTTSRQWTERVDRAVEAISGSRART